MVYCGKPSKGCSNCRERKIRCDQREPGCGQCEKRSQQCPGYRNIVDLMFRDESSHVIKKARAKQRKRGGAAAAISSEDSEPSPEGDSSTTGSVTSSSEPRRKPKHRLSLLTPMNTPCGTSLAPSSSTAPTTQLIWTQDDNLLPSPDGGSWPTTPGIALVYNLAPTCQERGTAYFFSRFVSINEAPCHQRFDFIYDVWKPVPTTTSTTASYFPSDDSARTQQLDSVMASMTAVGLVGVANLTHSTEMLDAARKSYGTALRLTNADLRNPAEATKDTTMLAVLILGLFEMMADPSLKTMKAWHEHVNGAAALAKVRGVNQFQTAAGIKMFNMLCQSVTLSCVQTASPMPRVLVDLQNDLGNVFRQKELGIELSAPVYSMIEVRHAMKTGSVTDPEEIFRRLVGVEEEFERTFAALPEQWWYKTMRVTRPHKAVFDDVYHVYPETWSRVWNGLREARVLVLESILSNIRKRFAGMDVATIPTGYIEAYRKHLHTLERVVGAIVASAPQHFGLLKPLGMRSIVDGAMGLISTTEVREPPTPPASSPESTGSCSSGASEEWQQEEKVVEDGGPTLMNPVRARTPEEEASRFMILASASDTLVWPLFCVGMSSVCTPAMRHYVVDRLNAIHDENGLKQAKAVAAIVRGCEVVVPAPWSKGPLARRQGSPGGIAPGAMPV